MTVTEVVRISVSIGGASPEAVAALVRESAERSGVAARQAELLEKTLTVVCRNVTARGFGPEHDGRYEVAVRVERANFVTAVEDTGLPFDYDALPEEGVPASAEVRFINLGRGGNRVEISTPIGVEQPSADTTSEGRSREGPVSEPAAVGDVEIRRMRPDEAVELTRAVYRSYGYSYDWDDIYYPERIADLQGRGLMRSVVAMADGEIAGHLAVMVEDARARVGEAGQAVVDPRFRGHRLFERLKTFAAKEAGEAGLLGLYSEATAAHPFSQKGNLHLGARETGFLLGYIPATVAYKEIGDPRAGRRGSVALFYMRAADEPVRDVFPPARYEEVVHKIIRNNGLRRTIVSETEVHYTEAPILDVKVRDDHNIAIINARNPGPDLASAVRPRLEELISRGVDCVYIDLPLCEPGTRAVDLAPLGFFFGGILPERDSAGDVMRLQFLNGASIVDPADVHTASPAGEGLLGLVLADMERT